MDFGRRLADPIMQDTVVKQLFFSPRGHGRFSLHTVRYDARAVHSNIIFFHVFWLPIEGILNRWGGRLGRQTASQKLQIQKRAKMVQRENSMPNLEIPLGLARKWLNNADTCSTMFASCKNRTKFGKFIKIVTENINFLNGKIS